MTMTMTGIAMSPTHLMSLFAQRAAAGDVDGLMALSEPDAVFEPQLGTVLRRGDAIRAALTAFAAMRPTIEYTGDTDCVIVERRRVAPPTRRVLADPHRPAPR